MTTTTPPPAAAERTTSSAPDAVTSSTTIWRDGTCRECSRSFTQRQERVRLGDREIAIPPASPICGECRQQHRNAEHEADLEREALRRAMILDREVPPLYAGATLDAVQGKHPELAAAMDEWINDLRLGGRSGLFLYGGYGVGKTFAALAFIRDALDRGTVDDVAFVNVVEFIEDAFAAMRDKTHIRRYTVERLKRVPLLVVDDLGAESPTPYVKAAVYSVVNARIVNPKLATIYTSNADLDTIGRRVDGRISSRIAGSCRVVELRGDDLRRARSVDA